MKKYLHTLIAFILTASVHAQDAPKKTQVKQVTKICDNLPAAEKPMVAVIPFKISAPNVGAQVSTGFSDMLLNAIFNTGCFRVVDNDRLKDIMAQQSLGQSGAGDETFAQAGKLAGAQVIIVGTITEFNEKAGGSSIGGAVIGLLAHNSRVGGAIGAATTVTSSISYTLRFENPTTGEVLDSKSFSKKTTAVGLAAGGGMAGMSGAGAGGGSFFQSKSMEKALEESLIEAVEYMSQNKAAYVDVMAQKKAALDAAQPKFNRADCALINSMHSPKIMVIIPEYHVTQRIPDPAAETEINRKLIEGGFHVIDPAIYASLNNSIEFKDAATDPARAISIGKKFGADIVIYGEAFSQRPGTVNGNDAGTINGMASCRARVEVRAVRTDNAEMIATNGFEAGAVDNAEFVAAKTALQKAGALTADYLMVQFCNNNLTFGGSQTSNGPAAIEITVYNADYSKVRSLATLLSQKYKIVSRSVADGKGIITVESAGDSQAMADFIDDKAHATYVIQSVEPGKIALNIK